MNLRYFKIYLACFNSFNSLNVGKFFWSWILKDCIEVKEKKKKVVVFVHVLDKTWSEALSRCNSAATAKKCRKKRDIHAKLLFCQSKPRESDLAHSLLSKPIAFLPFSLSSPSSLLKLPNVDIIKSGPKLPQRAEIYALLPDLAWEKTISAKMINKKKPSKALPI